MSENENSACYFGICIVLYIINHKLSCQLGILIVVLKLLSFEQRVILRCEH